MHINEKLKNYNLKNFFRLALNLLNLILFTIVALSLLYFIDLIDLNFLLHCDSDDSRSRLTRVLYFVIGAGLVAYGTILVVTFICVAYDNIKADQYNKKNKIKYVEKEVSKEVTENLRDIQQIKDLKNNPLSLKNNTTNLFSNTTNCNSYLDKNYLSAEISQFDIILTFIGLYDYTIFLLLPIFVFMLFICLFHSISQYVYK